jgi:GTPase SAR1 family protein
MSDFGVDDESVPIYQGKVIVLGDKGTGKSSLVRSLKPLITSEKSAVGDTTKSDVFSIVELTANEVQFNGKVLLKVWEYSGKDDPIVYEGALIVIVCIDLTAPDTAYSAFSRWTNLREKYMEESFLFVVGNFLESREERRVEISQVDFELTTYTYTYMTLVHP